MVMNVSIVLISLMTCKITRWLIIEKKLSPIRASSMFTLIVVTLFTLFNFEQYLTLSAAVLGASFVGMNETGRLSDRSMMFASLVFAFVFIFVLPFNKGLGGALGLAAFTSSVLTHFLGKNLKRLNTQADF